MKQNSADLRLSTSDPLALETEFTAGPGTATICLQSAAKVFKIWLRPEAVDMRKRAYKTCKGIF